MSNQNISNTISINVNDTIFDAVADSFGLQEVTTQRQRANGSRSFVDPKCVVFGQPVRYDVYPSGYVRRTTSEGSGGQYQLNPTRRTKLPSGRMATERVLSTSTNDSLGMLVRGVINYRENVVKNSAGQLMV
jgi:hypothetical protein